jgi:hypothetical protein
VPQRSVLPTRITQAIVTQIPDRVIGPAVTWLGIGCAPAEGCSQVVTDPTRAAATALVAGAWRGVHPRRWPAGVNGGWEEQKVFARSSP